MKLEDIENYLKQNSTPQLKYTLTDLAKKKIKKLLTLFPKNSLAKIQLAIVDYDVPLPTNEYFRNCDIEKRFKESIKNLCIPEKALKINIGTTEYKIRLFAV